MQKIVYAKFNNSTMPAQKVRLVADLVRGKKALDAIDILTFTNKAAAHDVIKVLNSAIANAVHNENLDKKVLVISKLLVDNATTYKRGRAVGRGRYHQIFKRNCHITIGVSEIDNNSQTKSASIKTEVDTKKTKVEVKATAKKETAVKAVKATTKNLKESKSSK